METVLNAENAAPVETVEADANTEATGSEGSAPSAPKAGTSEETSDWTEKAQKRYHELTRERYDALRERDIERYEKESLKARLDQLEKAKTQQVAPDTFPTLEQYGYDESRYIAAVAQYNAKQAEQVVETRLKAERDRQQQEVRQKGWQAKEAEFIKSKPDYVEKVQMARTLPISQEAQQALLESDLGPQVAYHLVENPDKAAAIMQLSVPAQLREIGRIEARLEAAKVAPKPPVSQAPSPVPKLDVENAAPSFKVDTPDSDNLSDAEWTKRRNAQEQARRRKRAGG